jgi:hypothetical protein
MDRSTILDRLRDRGWKVEEGPAEPFVLPPEIATRHQNIPSSLTAFLAGLRACVHPTETAWFLCQGDYARTAGSPWAWDEWEQMSLSACNGDGEQLSQVRDFWDEHLPFMFSVYQDYGYFAVRTAPEGFGRVVVGFAPYFEEPSVAADTFEAFLEWLVECPGEDVLVESLQGPP